jgi:hypothetical protein
VASHAETLGIRGYRQLHARNSAVGGAIAQSRSAVTGGWDGQALVWWDSEESLVEHVSTPDGQAASAALLEDEGRFIDLPNCNLFLTDDRTVVPFA